MVAEILSIGTELLMGQIANTDAQYIAQRLSELGVAMYRQTTVGDNPARVKEALAVALSRSDIVITTGGLGPTEDDLTKEMVAQTLGLPMVMDEGAKEHVVSWMTRYGKAMTENNLRQAYFPEGAIIMPNRCGTAPGCIVETHDKKAVAVLPGPPRELKDMFENALEPYLRARSGMTIHSRYLHIFGVGESRVETILKDLFHSENPTLALYCGAGQVYARITARVATGTDPAPLLDPIEAEIRARLGDSVYGEGFGWNLSKTVVQALLARGEHICFAESLTGGMLCARIVDVPGASAVLNESYTVYANESKEQLLGVSHETLVQHGAVSSQCAAEMALGACARSGAEWGVATTGIAGPDGATPAKPVGLVYVAIAHGENASVQELRFTGTRDWVRTLTCENALNLLRLEMQKVQ